MMKHSYANSQADRWFLDITENTAHFPFSFTYDGVRYTGFSKDAFELTEKAFVRDGEKETRNFCWKRDDHLLVRLKCTHYYDYGATEWTVWFENPSDSDSGVIENPESRLEFTGSYPVVKGILGDHTNWYRPYSADLSSMPLTFESNSGRATHVYFPYFNLQYGDCGTMLAIGWAGTWKADFRSMGNTTSWTARSVNNLRTRLKGGESIRTALFMRGDYTVREDHYATNYWRSWFVSHNLPKADADGSPLMPFSTASLASDTGLPNSDGSISERSFTWRRSMGKMLAEDVKVDFRWFDAGWYIAPDLTSPESDWWGTVGTWTLDHNKWPGDSFRESTDFARANGMKTLMWFEPERVTDPDSLAKNFGYNTQWAIRREGAKAVSNNIGNPECYRWTVDRIKKVLTENRVEMYREDNNSDPAGLWAYLDSLEGDGRRGITECKFIDAHYRMWDEIIECTLGFGGCGFVDSCASGGGRNDLESMRRGIPLLRSDYDRTTTAMRLSMTSAFNRWIPCCGAINKEKLSQLAPTGSLDPYVWRASYLPVLNVDSQYVQDPDQDFDMLRFGLKEWKRVNPYLLKDFYVLTPWHTEEENTGFTVYCFFDPEKNSGVLLAFRQEECTETTYPVTLPFVDEGETCTLTDEDSGEVLTISGTEMKTQGLTLTFEKPRTARLLWVKVSKA